MADGTAISEPDPRQRRRAVLGFFAGLGAYLIWGFVAIYFHHLMRRGVSPELLLAYRITWSFAFLLVLVTALGLWTEVIAAARSWSAVRALLISTLLIAVNWYTYIYAIATHQLSQASLGYYMNPLVNVLLGVVVLRERLRSMQTIAVALAAAGVMYLTVTTSHPPWVALVLAFSFGLYGLLRKTMPTGAIAGLMIETALCTPLTLGYIAYSHAWGGVPAYAMPVHGWLALSGVITATPLLLFAAAARRLRLTTVGFMQYVSPTIQLLIAVLLFAEPFTREKLITFACIWSAVALFMADQIRHARRTWPTPVTPIET